MIKFNYGKQSIEVDEKEQPVQFVNHSDPEKQINEEIFYSKLENYFNGFELSNMSVLIVVADKTRLCEYNIYLPVLERFLEEKRTDKINFIIAYGSHKPQNNTESEKAYGELYKKYEFIHFNQKQDSDFINLGTTSHGTEVTIRKEIFESDLVITFGPISHHYFAGYGGGRKLIFPGLAYIDSIYHNHGLFLDKNKNQLHSYCQSGILTGNPIAQDLKEIDELLPSRVSVHGIINSKGEVCNLEIYDSYRDFERMCSEYDQYFMINDHNEYDIVIASCGGYPKDINFIQSHKAIHNAAAFVKQGGILIMFAECIDGIGSDTLLPYFEMGYENAFKNLVNHYEGNGGTALSMMEKNQRIKIYMFTELVLSECKLLGINKITIEEIHELIDNPTRKIAIIQNASLVVRNKTAGL